jgi:hypothetical protein
MRVFRTSVEQRFIRKDHVIKYIFASKKEYAEKRLRKLKHFGYLKAVKVLSGHPECFLLDRKGVRALRAIYPVNLRGQDYPKTQRHIELSNYEHDFKVTEVRLIFENQGLCRDWKSEKWLKCGRKGDRKVPDGLFTRNGIGVAIELELHTKKAKTYHQVFSAYEQNPRIKYIFYVCDNLKRGQHILGLARRFQTREGRASKQYCLVLYQDLVDFREKAWFRGRWTERNSNFTTCWSADNALRLLRGPTPR